MANGFREWALVCNALNDGKQTILIRKGGIAEGREGFRYRHDAFFLMPSYFHEQQSKLRVPAETKAPVQPDGEVVITLFAKVEWTRNVTEWAQLESLVDFHILERQVVKDRFEYGEAHGANVAFLRVFRLQQPWLFADSTSYGGCRSWIEIPEPPQDLQMHPVLTEAQHCVVATRLGGLIG